MSEITLPDATARLKASDPNLSVIVQAPAGSGKTTLLVERYLNLLAQVDQPEEILAITFTKKAAAEMRHRIIDTLRQDSERTQNILQRDHQLGWNLLNNLQRLKVQTIDSFAFELLRMAPLSALSANTQIIEQADIYIEEAIDRLFLKLNTQLSTAPDASIIAGFLSHLDNNAATARRLIHNMLVRRDQWISLVMEIVFAYQPNHSEVANDEPNSLLLKQIESAQKSLIEQVQAPLLASLNKNDLESLNSLAEVFGCEATLDQVAPALLTSSGTLRKRLTKREGVTDTNLQRELNQWLKHIYERGIEDSFARVAKLPYGLEQKLNTEPLYMTCVCLALAASELDQLFKRNNVIDFTGLLIAAKQALRDESGPTELGLILDYKLKHILVDEYQDTSRAQAEFFDQLIEGWQTNDGNSFFVVGDPMQSVYRFRDADVGIFLSTYQHGMTSFPLTSLSLQANFRSQPNIVEWCNQTFNHLFTHTQDASTGAITYSPSIPMQSPQQDHPVRVLEFENELEEIDYVVKEINSLRHTTPTTSVAVLCRSRPQIANLLNAFEQNQINYIATDIEKLTSSLVVRDLTSLRHTLLATDHNHQTNKLAWFSLLRSPLVGIGLKELTSLSTQENWHNELQYHERATRLYTAWQWAKNKLYEVPLVEALIGYWQRAGGKEAYTNVENLYANEWFKCVEALGADAFDDDFLNLALDNLFAPNLASQPKSGAGTQVVEVMTIHKAKGLEFDHVFVPHLGLRTQSDDEELLSWRPHDQGLLMGFKGDQIHEWLKFEQREKAANEEKRLLYVACTRAKQSLTLTYKNSNPSAKPGGFAKYIYTQASLYTQTQSRDQHNRTINYQSQGDLFATNNLMRLKPSYQWQVPEHTVTNSRQRYKSAELDPLTQVDRHVEINIGLLVHRALMWLTQAGRTSIEPHQPAFARQPWQQRLQRWCKQQQVDDSILETVVSQSITQLEKVVQDPTGQWILAAREQEHSEWSIVFNAGADQPLQRLVIDRAFSADGKFWVIDYKTSQPDQTLSDDLLASYIQSQANRYASQLDRYSKAVTPLVDQPVQAALYFTNFAHLHKY